MNEEKEKQEDVEEVKPITLCGKAKYYLTKLFTYSILPLSLLGGGLIGPINNLLPVGKDKIFLMQVWKFIPVIIIFMALSPIYVAIQKYRG